MAMAIVPFFTDPVSANSYPQIGQTSLFSATSIAQEGHSLVCAIAI